jgi:hypothetical protein
MAALQRVVAVDELARSSRAGTDLAKVEASVRLHMSPSKVHLPAPHPASVLVDREARSASPHRIGASQRTGGKEWAWGGTGDSSSPARRATGAPDGADEAFLQSRIDKLWRVMQDALGQVKDVSMRDLSESAGALRRDLDAAQTEFFRHPGRGVSTQDFLH